MTDKPFRVFIAGMQWAVKYAPTKAEAEAWAVKRWTEMNGRRPTQVDAYEVTDRSA